MENKQVDKKTHKTYNKNISLEMLSSLGAGDGDSFMIETTAYK